LGLIKKGGKKRGKYRDKKIQMTTDEYSSRVGGKNEKPLYF